VKSFVTFDIYLHVDHIIIYILLCAIVMVLEHPFCQGMLFVQECLSLLSYVWCPPLVPKHATGFRFTTEFTTPHNV